MGIRTICPNGHQLNLKAFLAGKIGICPRCGVKFRIPSDTDATADDSGVVAATAPTPPSTPIRSVADGQLSAEPVATANRSPDAPVHSNVWYVCLPDRQTYGPIPRATVELWMAEGRLTQDSLVWCDAWTEWRSIATLAAVPSTSHPSRHNTPPASDLPPANSVPLSPTDSWPVAEQIRRRRQQRALSATVTIATILTVVCLALIAVLIWVLQ